MPAGPWAGSQQAADACGVTWPWGVMIPEGGAGRGLGAWWGGVTPTGAKGMLQFLHPEMCRMG